MRPKKDELKEIKETKKESRISKNMREREKRERERERERDRDRQTDRNK